MYKNTSNKHKRLTKRQIFAHFAKNVQKNLVVSNKYCNFAVVTQSNRLRYLLFGMIAFLFFC